MHILRVVCKWVSCKWGLALYNANCQTNRKKERREPLLLDAMFLLAWNGIASAIGSYCTCNNSRKRKALWFTDGTQILIYHIPAVLLYPKQKRLQKRYYWNWNTGNHTKSLQILTTCTTLGSPAGPTWEGETFWAILPDSCFYSQEK